MTHHKRRMAPRKRPRQARAVATVDAVLEAAAYILVRQGWEGFTTNRIADRAGVNIASLYQYFPNKESIAIELYRRHVDQATLSEPERQRLSSLKSLHALIRAIVEAAVDEHRRAPALHRAFDEELPRSARRAVNVHEAEQAREWTHMFAPLVRNVPDPDIAMFVAQAAGQAAIHEAASSRPDLLDNPVFVDEVVTLLERYLRRPR